MPEINCACGAENEATSDFCAGCGAQLVREMVSACAGCGEQLPDESRFCLNCGRAVEENGRGAGAAASSVETGGEWEKLFDGLGREDANAESSGGAESEFLALQREANEAAGRQDWGAAVGKLRAAIAAAGRDVPSELRKSLGVCLVNSAHKDVNQGVEMLNEAAREREDRVQGVLADFAKRCADFASQSECWCCRKSTKANEGLYQINVPDYGTPVFCCESCKNELQSEIDGVPGPADDAEAIALLREAYEDLVDALKTDPESDIAKKSMKDVEKMMSDLGVPLSARRPQRTKAARVTKPAPAAPLFDWFLLRERLTYKIVASVATLAVSLGIPLLTALIGDAGSVAAGWGQSVPLWAGLAVIVCGSGAVWLGPFVAGTGGLRATREFVGVSILPVLMMAMYVVGTLPLIGFALRTAIVNSDLPEHYSEFIAGPLGTSTTETPHIRGKLVVMDVGEEGIDELLFDLPDELVAKSYGEVGTVVLLRKDKKRVGRYRRTNAENAPAYVPTWEVEVIDWRDSQLIAKRTFEGGKPPRSVRDDEAAGFGSAPIREVAEYLRRIPRKEDVR